MELLVGIILGALVVALWSKKELTFHVKHSHVMPDIQELTEKQEQELLKQTEDMGNIVTAITSFLDEDGD